MHFLHIGKTGGTAIKHAVYSSAEKGVITLHVHTVFLRDVPVGEGVFFFLRDPVTRFVSGFNSRLRQGAPKFVRPWRPEEAVAFQHFQTPTALAEALSSPDEALRDRATAAMGAITHVKSSYYDWVGSDDYLGQRLDDVAVIGFQETLERDVAYLKSVGVMPHDGRLPGRADNAHRTPEGFETTLSALGRTNIEAWYARDIGLYARCRTIRRERWGLDDAEGVAA